MYFLRKHTRENACQDHTDEALIQLYKGTGKKMYVVELYERYVDKIYVIALKYVKDKEVSKDIVMIVFEKVLKNLPNTKVNAFGNWVHTITKNECNLYHRKKKNHNQKHQEWGDMEKNHQKNVENDPLSHLIDEEINDAERKKLIEGLESLKEHHRICIQLFYFEKKSYKEITQITNFSDKEVKSYIQHAKKNLKKYLVSDKK